MFLKAALFGICPSGKFEGKANVCKQEGSSGYARCCHGHKKLRPGAVEKLELEVEAIELYPATRIMTMSMSIETC
jgi:hypothetical protein